MSVQTLRKQLLSYQRLMVEARTTGDLAAYEVYRDQTRKIADQIREKEITARSERTA